MHPILHSLRSLVRSFLTFNDGFAIFHPVSILSEIKIYQTESLDLFVSCEDHILIHKYKMCDSFQRIEAIFHFQSFHRVVVKFYCEKSSNFLYKKTLFFNLEAAVNVWLRLFTFDDQLKMKATLLFRESSSLTDFTHEYHFVSG